MKDLQEQGWWEPRLQWKNERQARIELNLAEAPSEQAHRSYSQENRARAAARNAQQNIDALHRAQAYRLLGECFDVPPPPPIGGGDHTVVYDHDAIDAGVRELNEIAARAQANLDAARQARLNMQQDATGVSADSAQHALLQIEQVNRRILAAVVGALRALGIANDEMAQLEQKNAAGFVQ